MKKILLFIFSLIHFAATAQVQIANLPTYSANVTTDFLLIGEAAGVPGSSKKKTIASFLSTYSLTTNGYVNGGNAFGGNATLGLTDSFHLSVQTNATTRLKIFNTGNVLVGTGSLTSHNEKFGVQGTSAFTDTVFFDGHYKYTQGTPGVGKALLDNGDGIGIPSWQALPTASLTAGDGISLNGSAGTYTITNIGYINGGNSFGGNATIGLNDAFRLDFETNGTTRMGILSGGQIGIGTTGSTQRLLNIAALASSGHRSGIFLSLTGSPSFSDNAYAIRLSNNASNVDGANYGVGITDVSGSEIENTGVSATVSGPGLANTGVAVGVTGDGTVGQFNRGFYAIVSDASAHPSTDSYGIDVRVTSADGVNYGALIDVSGGATNEAIHVENGASSLKTTTVTGSFVYVDGNEASGYVLTSDANGAATWQAPTGGGGSSVDTIIAGTGISITNSSGSYTVTNTGVPNQKLASVGITIDGNGGVVGTGQYGNVVIPYTGTITGWQIFEISSTPVSSSAVIDVWKDTYANYPPTVADAITGSEKPTLSTATKNQDLSLSSWTTSVTAGDILRFNVDSSANGVIYQVVIFITKT